MKKITRCTTLIALIGLVLTLGFVSVPVLACVPSNKATTIVIKADLWNNELGLPLSLDICASGSNHLLIGIGTTNDPACGKSIITMTGCINGHSLTLTGQIVKGLDTPQLKGTKIKLDADLQTGNMILTFGPISPGLPLSGFTFIFKGTGEVSLKP
jgi:hypothetical protein